MSIALKALHKIRIELLYDYYLYWEYDPFFIFISRKLWMNVIFILEVSLVFKKFFSFKSRWLANASISMYHTDSKFTTTDDPLSVTIVVLCYMVCSDKDYSARVCRKICIILYKYICLFLQHYNSFSVICKNHTFSNIRIVSQKSFA